MKLKTFTPKQYTNTRGGGRNSTPSLSINTKAGTIRMNMAAAKQMDLKDGSQVLFYQDETDPENWYLGEVEKDGFVLRERKAPNKGLMFNAAGLAREIAESVAFIETSGKCLVAGQATETSEGVLWGVLTSTLKNK